MPRLPFNPMVPPRFPSAPAAMYEQVATHPQYLVLVGAFQTCWGAAELVLDCAVSRLLGIDAEATLYIVSGMQMGAKTSLVRGLAKKLHLENQSKLNAALKIFQEESKRNAFAHGYISSKNDHVVYIERLRNQRPRLHKITLKSLGEHILQFNQASIDIGEALGISNEQQEDFMDAVTKLAKINNVANRNF